MSKFWLLLNSSRGSFNVGSTLLLSEMPKTGRWHRDRSSTCVCGQAAGPLHLRLSWPSRGPHDHPEVSSVTGCSINLKWTVELSWLGISTDGLLSEHCAWHSCYAPVDQLLASGSDTALPCCETLTTLILNWHKILYRAEDREMDGRGWVVLSALGFSPSRYIWGESLLDLYWCGDKHKGG